jgi:S-adenosylmethionine:tRNA ribosyltransferase-isomerase
LKLHDFDYELPDELIAQYPSSKRDESRLILFDRRSDELRETRFVNFPRYLREGDLVVVNESKVIPARIRARRRTGGAVEVFLTRRLAPGIWYAMIRPSRRIGPGEMVFVGGTGHAITIEKRVDHGLWRIVLPERIGEREFFERYGHVPLPPYIRRDDRHADRERYQTVFARYEGSVAAPTAGLHFTEEIVREMRRRGVTLVPLTLHVGPGTFRPLTFDEVEGNEIEPEFLMIRGEYWEEVEEARRQGRRIVVVGTSTTRALESLAAGTLAECEERYLEGARYITGWTDLFIYPGFSFQVVDALLTNLHLPRSSLLLLVAAFAGREEILRVYHWAISRKFRFYSYGDAMFIR